MNNDHDEKKDMAACGCGGGSCCGGPGKWIWMALAVAVLGVAIARNAGRKPASALSVPGDRALKAGEPESARQGRALPRLVDLGAGACIPCKAMKPILDDLMENHAGTFKTEFIDVWKDKAAGKAYNIKMIPTQIFFDADGRERFRHEGFMSKEKILATWRELGVAPDGDE